MKVYQALGPGIGGFCEVETPAPAKDQVLVKISYCGVCGTDYALFSGNSSFIHNNQATYPIRLGHEWSGTVVAVGDEVQKVQIGDSVVGDNYVSCGECPACLRQDYNYCTGRNHVGTINPCWPGAFAEYFLVPERHVYKLADNVSLLEAALCEPLSVAYGGIKKMNITEDSIVVVIGTGCIAMSAAALARYKGAGEVYIVGRNQYKLNVGETLGITGTINSTEVDIEEELLRRTGGRYADFILECSGHPATVEQALQLAAQKATVALIGFYERPLTELNIDILVAKELTLVGIMGEYGNLQAVSKIMAEYDLQLTQVITEQISFEECDKAFHPESHQKIIKTMIHMN